MPSLSRRGLTYLGLDVSKNTIAVGILRAEEKIPDVETIAHDEASVRRLVARVGPPSKLVACYEAGPTGYELHRLFTSMGVRCDVVAPSLIPTASGDRVKTDQRDGKRLARLHRAGELVSVRVPSRAEEGVRDLCRARLAAIKDRRRARQRLGSFLLRHNEVWRGGDTWTLKHHAWVAARRFDEPAVAAAFSFYRAEVVAREATVNAIDAELRPWFAREPFAEPIRRLGAYRGIAEIGAITLACEVCDWRRFPHASSFMAFSGLVPSEYSSGERTWRGPLTCTGNEHVRRQLVESAWSYRFRPYLTADLRHRHQHVGPEIVARSWAAQLRLCGRWRRLAARKDSTNTVTAAVARELAGFVWAEMTA